MATRYMAWMAASFALLLPTTAFGQGTATGTTATVVRGYPTDTGRIPGVYAAPGYYGTSWGTPSYGLVRTYSEFASPYGAGYGYGYPPSTFLPGPFGVGLWRPELAGTQVSKGNGYRTFRYPYDPASKAWTPPFGVYAPAYGPSANYGSAAFDGW